MRVVGVGERAAVHGPDVVVADLTQVRIEPGEDGTLRLSVG